MLLIISCYKIQMQIEQPTFSQLNLPPPQPCPSHHPSSEQTIYINNCFQKRPYLPSYQHQESTTSELVTQTEPAKTSKPSEVSEPWQMRCSRKQKILCIVALSLFVLAISVTVFLLVYSRSTIHFVGERSYNIIGSQQVMRIQYFQFIEPHLLVTNSITEGQLIMLDNNNQKKEVVAPTIIKVSDKELGITVQALDRSNIIVQVDINRFLLQFGKQNSQQAKALAQSFLSSQQQQLIAQSLGKSMMEASNMNGTVESRLQWVYKAARTAQGYQLQMKQPKSRRLQSLNRRLFGLKSAFKAVIDKGKSVVKSLVQKIQSISTDTKPKYIVANQAYIENIKLSVDSDASDTDTSIYDCNTNECDSNKDQPASADNQPTSADNQPTSADNQPTSDVSKVKSDASVNKIQKRMLGSQASRKGVSVAVSCNQQMSQDSIIQCPIGIFKNNLIPKSGQAKDQEFLRKPVLVIALKQVLEMMIPAQQVQQNHIDFKGSH